MVGRLVVVVLAVLSASASVSASLDEGQKEAARAAFKQLLRLQPPPAEGWAAPARHPPRHMMELYRRFRQHGGPGRHGGNTVRSILPTVQETELLLFNVTCIGRAEEVHLAQLHLHRRRLRRTTATSHRRRMLAPPCKVKLYRVISNPRKHRSRTAPLASLPVPESIRGGWHSLDITPILRELLLGGSASSVLQLGVRFESPRGRTLSPDQFLNVDNDTASFVVVFSEDYLDNTVEPEVREALHRIRGDDLYLEEGDYPGPQEGDDELEDEDEDEEDLDDFSFEEARAAIQKKKQHQQQARKTTVKGVLESLDEDFKVETERSNDLEDDDDEGNDLRKSPPVEKKNWPKKEKNWQNGKEHMKNDVFRRRRMHPKSRYRVKMWKDVDAYAGYNTKKDDKEGGRSAKYAEETQKKMMRRMEEEVEGKESVRAKRQAEGAEDRGRRSIHDNELPDTGVGGQPEVPRGSPESVLHDRESQTTHRHVGELIPYPTPSNRRWRGENKRRRGQGRKRDNKKKGKKGKKGVDTWQMALDQVNSSRADGQACHRKKLLVNFVEIGWGNWIISPPDFEAYYCTGRCSYPLSKVAKPTNHATLQSLISALGRQPAVPEPCCVPDKLSPTSLLYLDDNQNVVLKRYVDMTVESCACR